MMRTQYVCGFLFDSDAQTVLLIVKNRPAWQEGLLNGIGGKVEPGESHAEAIVREFREEALHEDPAFEPTWEWTQFAVLEGPDYTVSLWSAFASAETNVSHWSGLRNDVGEVLEAHDVDFLFQEDTVPNLSWIVPLALDCRRQRREVIRVVDE